MIPEQQAILARDMIQMIRDYKGDADILEYLEGFAFAIARGIEDDSVVNWDDIAGVCDQRYYSLRQGNPIELNEDMLNKCELQIQKYLPKSSLDNME